MPKAKSLGTWEQHLERALGPAAIRILLVDTGVSSKPLKEGFSGSPDQIHPTEAILCVAEMTIIGRSEEPRSHVH